MPFFKYYSSTTPYYKVLLQYYSNTTPILLCTTKHYSSTTPYYRALLRPLKRRQNDVLPVLFRTTPVLEKLPKRAFRARLPSNFTDPCFQIERFARCFQQFCKKKLPKWSFRARLLPNFTEQASKTSVSHDASDNFARNSLQNERFVRGFFQISQNKLPKRAFRAMLPTIFTKNLPFATVSCNRHAASCERVHPPKAKCASHYNAVHSQMWQCAFRHSAVHKNVWIYPPWTDPLRAHFLLRFYYSFRRSTPRFYREGWPIENEICVSLQFWAIDSTFFARGLPDGNRNLRFATVLGDRHHVFSERVDREKMKFAFRYSFGRSTTRF